MAAINGSQALLTKVLCVLMLPVFFSLLTCSSSFSVAWLQRETGWLPFWHFCEPKGKNYFKILKQFKRSPKIYDYIEKNRAHLLLPICLGQPVGIWILYFSFNVIRVSLGYLDRMTWLWMELAKVDHLLVCNFKKRSRTQVGVCVLSMFAGWTLLYYIIGKSIFPVLYF
jgi:hypothetical protein